MIETLDSFSLLSLISAIVLYAVAFIFYSLELGRLGAAAAAVPQRASVAQRVPVGAGAPTPAAPTPAPAAAPAARGSWYSRVALTLTALGAALHLVAAVLRGIAGERVPWANMYEFAMTGTFLMVAVYLGLLLVKDLRYLGAIVVGFVVVLLGLATVNFRVDVAPLPPALQSYWLVIHVLVATLAIAFLFIGFAMNVIQLLQTRSGALAAGGRRDPLARYLRPLPDADTLENGAYRVIIVGFIFWTFTLIAGAIWAADAWGRYWGWDTKEVWTFIIWVLYAGYIHARATRGWRGTRSAWLSIVAFGAIIFNYAIVNVFFEGLHSYSGL